MGDDINNKPLQASWLDPSPEATTSWGKMDFSFPDPVVEQVSAVLAAAAVDAAEGSADSGSSASADAATSGGAAGGGGAGEAGEVYVPNTDAAAAGTSEADLFKVENNKLVCVGQDLETLPESMRECPTSITSIDLSFNSLTEISLLSNFPNVEEFVADNNDLGNAMRLPHWPKLRTLSLNKNKLSDIEALLEDIKKNAPQLTFLSLLGNQACPNELVAKDEDDYQRYRYLVLYNLPNLKFLDSRHVTPEELKEAKRVGSFTKVVRFTEEDFQKQSASPSKKDTQGSAFSPLPQSTRELTDHKGSIGQCKYVYYGRHSEGNRFIRNNDL